MTRTKTVGVVVLAFLVVLAGCGASDGGSLSAQGGTDGGGGSMLDPDGAAESTSESDDSGTSAATAERSGRILVRTGQVRLDVDEFDATRTRLVDAARRYGGFVGDSHEQVHRRGNETWTEGTVVLRVPAENFSALVEAVRAEGRAVEASTNTEDVTDQVVDLEARLANLRAERDRLRTLYDRANETEDVLAVAERLADVQGEIERTEARLRTLDRQVSYATLTVSMREPRPDRDRSIPDRWYETPVLSAFLESVDGVGVVLRALVVAAAYAAPYALVFGAPFVVVGGLLYRHWR